MRQEKSVAIRYDRSLPAPFIVARGKGHLAERIRQIAREAGVSIVEAPDLADTLVDLDVGSLIPEEFYQIIAEILVFVKDVDGRWR